MQYAARITLSANSPEPAFTGGPFVSGVAKLDTANPATTGWDNTFLKSCAEFGERVDIVTGGNYGQLLDTTIEVSNHDKWYAAFQAAGASLIGAKVEIGQAVDASTITARWTGIVADASFQGVNVEMRVENILAARHKEIPARVLTQSEFPALSDGSSGAPVPIIYGDVDALEPPSLQSEKDYRPCLSVEDAGDTRRQRNQTYSLINSGVPANTITQLTLATWVASLPPGGVGEHFWLSDIAAGDTAPYYIEFVSGTGAGQTRLFASLVSTGSYTASIGYAVGYAVVSLSVPLATLPDSTTVIKVYRTENIGQLALADECVLDRVYIHQNDRDYGIASTQETVSDIDIANISAEFKSGNNYAAITYRKPTQVFGVTALSDGLAASSPYSANFVGVMTYGIYVFADAICRSLLYLDTITDASIIEDSPDIYAVVSCSSSYTSGKIRLVVNGLRWDGTEDVIQAPAVFSNNSYFVNGFSPAMATDGTAGNFGAYAFKLPSLPASLDAYRILKLGVLSDWSRANPVRIDTDVAITNGGNSFRIYHPGFDPFSLPSAGMYVRTALCSSTDDALQARYNRDRFNTKPSATINSYGATSDWREITSVVPDTGDYYIVTVSGTFTEETAPYTMLYTLASDFLTSTEYECGFAFSAGDVEASSPFRADIISGRTFSASWPELPAGASVGDPITLARDAVLDMYYRDLGLGADAVDFDAFQALPAVEIHSALVERVNSADRVAELCQQFNWVVGHDADGRETATAWLARVGTEDYDYSIDTGDVTQGSLTGVSVSDVIDLCNLPNMKWNWTQADGYRSESNVVDVTTDPLSLNASNYLQYITGFGDFSTALDVYTQLHGAWSLNNRQNSASFDLPDVGSDASSVLWPTVGMDRFTWMSSRKPLYQMSVPDTSSAWLATVGKRIRLRHKRYTGGAWVYGTVVEWSYDPESAECRITIMGDPSAAVPDLMLFVDTIDPTATAPEYADQIDGLPEQYTDSIAGAP